MKKTTIFLIITLSVLFILIGCSSNIKISCDNQSPYYVKVSGDAEGTIPPKESKSFSIQTGGCLQFVGVESETSTITVKDWGRHCFTESSGYTFYDDQY